MSSNKIYSKEDIATIGNRVRERRIQLTMSQRQLADKINAEKNIIQRIESGNLKSANVERLLLLAGFLDCNPQYLILESDDPRAFHSNEDPTYNIPRFQYSAEHFLYSNPKLRQDFTYIGQYMHPDFQELILKLIHMIVIFHKHGVHFPNIEPQKASSIGYNECFQTLKDDFFEKERNKWIRPKPSATIK